MAKKIKNDALNIDNILFKCRNALRAARNTCSIFEKKIYDVNIFFLRLHESDDWVATWRDSPITKVKHVLNKIFVENEYQDNTYSDHLNKVCLNPVPESTVRSYNDDIILPALNYFA